VARDLETLARRVTPNGKRYLVKIALIDPDTGEEYVERTGTFLDWRFSVHNNPFPGGRQTAEIEISIDVDERWYRDAQRSNKAPDRGGSSEIRAKALEDGIRPRD
jgi:hypothetical protein